MKITVELMKDGYWQITSSENESELLNYEEMLGLFTAMTMPQKPKCLNWLKPKRHIDSAKENFKILTTDELNRKLLTEFMAKLSSIDDSFNTKDIEIQLTMLMLEYDKDKFAQFIVSSENEILIHYREKFIVKQLFNEFKNKQL